MNTDITKKFFPECSTEEELITELHDILSSTVEIHGELLKMQINRDYDLHRISKAIVLAMALA